jgi:predicted deacetylase
MSGAGAVQLKAAMPSAEVQRHLCLSLHDVAPATWELCERLLASVGAVTSVPLTLLVVPAYHGAAQDVPWYDAQLERRLALGDELALHGYTHLDDGLPPRSLRERYARHVYTKGEGEFAALPEQEASRRLELGLVYTTTWRHFHFLQDAVSLEAPSLVYSSRNAWGRALSRQAVSWAGMGQRDAPLVRLSLHPRDALDPHTVRHFQKLLATLLASRRPATKAAFARYWRNRKTKPVAHEIAV